MVVDDAERLRLLAPTFVLFTYTGVGYTAVLIFILVRGSLCAAT